MPGVPGLPRRPTGLLRLVGGARAAAGAVPPPALVMLSMASAQLGSAVAKTLFASLPPPAVALMRLGLAAVVVFPIARPRIRSWSLRDALVAAALGLTLAGMNLAFYEAIDRVPLGVAVTVEFLGPLSVAIAGSRSWLDGLWVLLAGGGVVLLAHGGGSVSLVGVLFAALAGVGWASYILLTAAVGRRFEGLSGLSIPFAVGALAVLPFGLGSAGTQLLDARLLLVGAAVALLSSVVPYTLELQALRRIPPHLFGLLMSMEPAIAALLGFAVLGEVLAVREWAAVALVVLACVGSTRWSRNASGNEG